MPGHAPTPPRFDVAVVGAGAAGLYAALVAAGEGARVALVSRSPLAECVVFGRRAALAATADPDPPADPGPPPEPLPRPAPRPAKRRARRSWGLAGLERDAAGLEELARDPFPLARAIAAACLAREESRGAHQRRDFPATSAALDGVHVVLRGEAEPTLESWE